MGADAVFEVVVDRADLDLVLHRPEGPFGHLELLVGATTDSELESVESAQVVRIT